MFRELFVSKFGLATIDILKSYNIRYYYDYFRKFIHADVDKIKDYQFIKLKKLLIHSYEHVEYYKSLYDAHGFDPYKISSFDDIKAIPPLKREDLQKHWQRIISKNSTPKHLEKGSSSGSTGLPVIYYKDNMATSAGKAAGLVGWSLSGWQLNMKGLHIWGNPSIVKNEWKRLSSKLKARIFAHHKFPAYKLTEESECYNLYKLIQKNRYDYLDGYTNAIYFFADYLKQNNLKLTHEVKFVFTTAENLHEFQRKTIENIIAPVYDAYGCGEINGIAYQCRGCASYHVIDPHVYLEYGDQVDDNGSRELFITDLDNYGFPLIRYKNDDLGTPLPEDRNMCSVKFSSIAGISGRQSDIIYLPNGGTLSVPSFFGSMLLKKVNGLKQYQIEKVDDDRIVVNLVKTSEFSANDKNNVESALMNYLANKIDYQIRYVDRIESSTNGKFKLLVDRTK